MTTTTRKMPTILTTETRPSLTEALQAAERASLSVLTERHRSVSQTYTYHRIQIGTVTVRAFESRYRDLGEGPSWQERYSLPMDVVVPIYWIPTDVGYAVSVTFPVVSTMRQSGVKLGGVSLAHDEDTEPRTSQHTQRTYDYAAFGEIGKTGTLFGHAVNLAHGVSFREVPYAHDPSRARWVMDIGTDHR